MIDLKELSKFLDAEGIKTTYQRNANRDALAIGTGMIRPMVYADRFDSLYDAVAFAEELAAQQPPALSDVIEDMLTSVDYVKAHLRLGIRPLADDGVLTRPLLDVELYTYILLEDVSDADQMAACNVVGAYLKVWDLTEDELFQTASDNTVYESVGMAYMMKELLMKEGAPEELADRLTAGINDPMYVITTPNRYRGASALADSNLFYDIAEHLESDLVIFPSSIHELIAVPYNPDLGDDTYKDMVAETNFKEVDTAEVLSDNAYLYRRETGQITIL